MNRRRRFKAKARRRAIKLNLRRATLTDMGFYVVTHSYADRLFPDRWRPDGTQLPSNWRIVG